MSTAPLPVSPLPASRSRDSLADLRARVADLRGPRPLLYWTDHLLTTAICWWAIAAAAGQPLGSAAFLLLTAAGSLALARSFLLVHELTHQPQGALRGLRLAWNLLVGLPLFAPSFIYETVHRDHHRLRVYRTDADPEHFPDVRSVARRTLETVLGSLLLPVLLAVRWGLVGPVSLLHAPWRAWVEARFSSLTVNPNYRRSPLSPHEARRARAAELAATLWTWVLTALVLEGIVPVAGVAAAALVLAGAIAQSALRGELLHRFESGGVLGTLERQVRDSVNVPHTGVASALLLPLGIGYHALHHLDPLLPYHAMEAAHRRLVEALPEPSLYRQVTVPSLGWAAIRTATEAIPLPGCLLGSLRLLR